MVLSCSATMIKYLMFIFNLLFVITGIIIVAVGATVKTVYTDYSTFLDDKYFSLPNLLIATGSLIFIISFFGCCGAIKQNWLMLGVFSILMIFIFIFEFSAGIAGYVLRDRTADYLNSTLNDNLLTYRNKTKDIWDLIQRDFQCCGVNSPADWLEVFPDYSLPVSCCPAVDGTVGEFYCNSYIPQITTKSSNIPTPTTTTPPKTTAGTPSSKVTKNTVKSTQSSAATTHTPVQSSTQPSSISEETTVNNTSQSPAPSPKKSVVKRQADSNAGTTQVTPSSDSTSTPYSTGCKVAFGNYIKDHAVQIGGCAMALAVIQLLGIVFSCHLVRQLRNGGYSM